MKFENLKFCLKKVFSCKRGGVYSTRGYSVGLELHWPAAGADLGRFFS